MNGTARSSEKARTPPQAADAEPLCGIPASSNAHHSPCLPLSPTASLMLCLASACGVAAVTAAAFLPTLPRRCLPLALAALPPSLLPSSVPQTCQNDLYRAESVQNLNVSSAKCCDDNPVAGSARCDWEASGERPPKSRYAQCRLCREAVWEEKKGDDRNAGGSVRCYWIRFLHPGRIAHLPVEEGVGIAAGDDDVVDVVLQLVHQPPLHAARCATHTQATNLSGCAALQQGAGSAAAHVAQGCCTATHPSPSRVLICCHSALPCSRASCSACLSHCPVPPPLRLLLLPPTHRPSSHWTTCPRPRRP